MAFKTKAEIEASSSDLVQIPEPADLKKQLNLSPDQAELLKMLKTWWLGKEQCMVVKGKPGTGKTFITKMFTRTMADTIPKFTAPTHEAAYQLELALGEVLDPPCTTHSALGLSMSMNSSKQKLYQRKLPDDFGLYNLMVVDEASMADKQNPKIRKSERGLIDYALDSGIRILWLGDWAQLPPVNSENGTSPVFELGYRSFELSTVKRNSGVILAYSDLVRAELTNPIKNLPKPLDGIEQFTRNASGLIDLGLDDFEKIITGKISILVWTNAATKYSRIPGAAEYSHMIRCRLFGEALASESPYIPGDQVLFSSPLYLVEGDPKMHERLAVETYSKKDFTIAASVNTKGKVVQVETLSLMGVEVYKLSIESAQKGNLVAYTPTRGGSVKYAKKLEALRTEAVETNSGQEAAKLWQAFHLYKGCFAELKYNYCKTTHRAQGSTMEGSIVDVGNILQNRERLVAFKSIHVAVSRPTQTLKLIRG